jgi:alkaline phosphatase D
MATIDRRTLMRAGIAAGAGLGAGALLGGAADGRTPAFRHAGRPALTHGVQSGDVTAAAATVWTRADRPGRLYLEVSRRPDFRHGRRMRGPVLTPASDLTGKLRLHGLPAGTQLHYRVRVESLDRPGLVSEPLVGSFRTAPVDRRDIRFVWSGDIAGQGWGINPELGGMRLFRSARELRPDFFLCSGDTVYSDGPLAEAVTLPDGRVWRNLLTPAKSKVAESLGEFRGQYAYNLLDEHLRAFAAEVPQVNQWDDHEVVNNWYPGEILDDPRYAEKDVDVLAARARRAFHEWLPTSGDRIYRRLSYGPRLDLFVLDMRTFKDPNGDPRRGVLGERQRAWLIQELRRSRATWKVIAADLPLGLVVPDGATAQEGIAQGDGGPPAGRELEFAEVLGSAHRAGVTGIVFLTADVHYTAAHDYHPDRAAIGEFSPFWEFVSGPAHAGGFGPNRLDATFGPQAVFVHAPPTPNTSPADGYQHFGEVRIDGDSGVMTVNLRDQDGSALWSTTLTP